MEARGFVHKYGNDVDTDVIIPARYLNTSDPKELAEKCMIDIDADFVILWWQETTLAVVLQGSMHR